jgi:hypothetical protein
MELKTTLGKLAIVNNVAGEMGARAVREFRGARADGSQILILAASRTQPVPDLSGLVPVATIVGDTGNYRWVGVFAPPGTPAGIVSGLERAVIAAVNSPGFRQRAGEVRLSATQVGFTPAPGDGAQLAQLVAQTPVGVATPPPATVLSGQPAVPVGAPSPSADRSSPSSGGWPAGVEPGNLYVVEYRFSTAYTSTYLLVAAKSKPEVETLVNNAATEFRKTLHPDALPHYRITFEIVGECNGPNWGAVVSYIPGEPRGLYRKGWSCAAKSPREAILAATKFCSTKTGTACDSMIAGSHETLHVSIGHSSARAWFPNAPTLPGYPPATMRWPALGATTAQFSGGNFVTSPQDAINQLGKACGPAGVHSCWITSKNWACLNASTTRKQGECVDTKLTADGYLP